MKKIIIALASTTLLVFSAASFSSVKLSLHPDKLPETGNIQGKIYRVTSNDQQNNPWIRVFVGREKNQQYVLEFKDTDIAVGDTLLNAQGKYIDALYAYSNGAYHVTFFEIS